MKKLHFILICLSVSILMACSGSETYRGNWKAMDNSGNKIDIFFDAKLMRLSDSTGEKKEYGYTQNSVNITNGVETYGIVVKEVGTYQLYFPYTDESKGFITDANDNVLYTINRNTYMTYDEANRLD